MTGKQIVLWDIDGVVVTFSRDPMQDWRRELIENGLHPFYLSFEKTPGWAACVRGECDFFDTLRSHADVFGISHAKAEQTGQIWLEQNSRIDPDMMTFIRGLKQADVSNIVASNQEHHRANHLERLLGGNTLFDRHFYSCRLGVAKPSEQFYQAIAAELPPSGMPPVFIDDREDNLVVPRRMGWRTYHYTGTGSLTPLLEEVRARSSGAYPSNPPVLNR